jgi:GAF domain-containing protein
MSDLTELHRALAGVVLVDRKLPDVLSEIAGIARRSIRGSEASSITLVRGDKGYTAAFDGQLAMDADELQYQRDYGPCVDAGRTGQVFLVADMRTEQRWPDYAQHAAAQGVGSSLSVPLPFQAAVIGALNNYAGRPHAFTEDDIPLAEEVAAWVALTVGSTDHIARTHEDVTNLRTAMRSRAVIGQAMGILMERHKFTADQAFRALSRVSQNTNIKLRDVAEELVTTGALPAVTSTA